MPGKGRGCKVAKGVVKVVHKILVNFEVIVHIRVHFGFIKKMGTEKVKLMGFFLFKLHVALLF